MKRVLITFAAVMFGVVAMLAKDIKTLVVSTNPQMHCESCENKIKNGLRFEKGVKSITTDLATQTVVVGYDADKTTEANIVKAFSKIGYQTTKKAAPAKKCAGKGNNGKKAVKKAKKVSVDANTGASPRGER